jgi:pyochelin biosynthesis protein PchC
MSTLTVDAEEDKWIRCFHPCPGGSSRLVCFPHAGGSATYYFSLSRLLVPEVEVLAVQYPGRQDRRNEPCIGNIADLADRVAGVLAGKMSAPDDAARGGNGGLPFAFLGHSMGATLAFEVARRFQRRHGRGPRWLFVSGRNAPSRRRDGDIHKRDDAGLVAALREIGGTDERLFDDEELLATVLRVTRNDYKAAETYVWSPGPRLTCPITVLVGDADPQTTMDGASAWAEHTTGPFDLQVFPGGHFYLDIHRADVSETISATLRGISDVNSHEERSS